MQSETDPRSLDITPRNQERGVFALRFSLFGEWLFRRLSEWVVDSITKLRCTIWVRGLEVRKEWGMMGFVLGIKQ
jgi:hypothetical protein